MRIIKYSLNDEFGIYIEERGPNSWAVVYAGMNLNVNGGWDYESSPSNRPEDYLQTHRYPTPEAARDAFLEHKHKLNINGRTL